jgi:hypothetical protein
MVEQADVYVKNIISIGSPPPDIRVIRKLPDGSSDIDVTITPGDEEKIPLPSTDVKLIANTLDGWTINGTVTKGDDIISCSRNSPDLIIQIMVPNSAVPEVPTTVNVEISGDPP